MLEKLNENEYWKAELVNGNLHNQIKPSNQLGNETYKCLQNNFTATPSMPLPLYNLYINEIICTFSSTELLNKQNN